MGKFRVETIFEMLRVSNFDFGFLVERVRSDFPADGLKFPKRPRWTKRIKVDTKNIWMPVGGGQIGTLMVSISRVHVGFPVPQSVLRFVFHNFAPSILDNIRRGAIMAKEPGSPWYERMQRDRDGFYAELARIEAA